MSDGRDLPPAVRAAGAELLAGPGGRDTPHVGRLVDSLSAKRPDREAIDRHP